LLTFSEYQQHLAFFATLKFAEAHKGKLPAANSKQDAAAVAQLARDLLASKQVDVEGLEADDAFVQK